MKPAVALFVGVFASGLALAGYMKPEKHKVSCRTFYGQIAGPSFEDRDSDAVHAETFIDKVNKVEFSFHWDEASTFRNLNAEIKLRDHSGNLESASNSGKEATVVHLETGNETVSLFCGIVQLP